ncbi:MAG: aminomethyl-transferring glycine dehydrogenase subunit GcvPA [Pseudomonadales bacterium]
MPFVPHTTQDEQTMLDAIGVNSIEDLFDEIPPELRSGVLKDTPEAITEMALVRLMSERARQDEVDLSFLGAGAYHHHIPAAVWDLTTRGEFMTAYTPYQAEASQGTLQLIYEFQTMITRLTGMDVANASVYDGASALAEAVLMAVRANRKSKSRAVLLAGNMHPNYISAVRNIVRNQDIEIVMVPYAEDTGSIDMAALQEFAGQDFAALAISYPNFFGGLEAVHQLTDFAHANGQLLIGVVNPMALGVLAGPGNWGEQGADIVVGEGQPFGIPVSSGGPYLGYMCCKQAIVRQMPGRIIGMTEDTDGKTGFALTLQAREQHIRRGKATSNICTNQGLLVTAATIYLSLMGDAGLSNIAAKCHQGINQLIHAATGLDGVSVKFSQPIFHETVLELPRPASEVLANMAGAGVLGGYDLGLVSPDLKNCMLTNVTEVKTADDIATFVTALQAALEAS